METKNPGKLCDYKAKSSNYFRRENIDMGVRSEAREGGEPEKLFALVLTVISSA